MTMSVCITLNNKSYPKKLSIHIWERGLATYFEHDLIIYWHQCSGTAGVQMELLGWQWSVVLLGRLHLQEHEHTYNYKEVTTFWTLTYKHITELFWIFSLSFNLYASHMLQNLHLSHITNQINLLVSLFTLILIKFHTRNSQNTHKLTCWFSHYRIHSLYLVKVPPCIVSCFYILKL